MSSSERVWNGPFRMTKLIYSCPGRQKPDLLKLCPDRPFWQAFLLVERSGSWMFQFESQRFSWNFLLKRRFSMENRMKLAQNFDWNCQSSWHRIDLGETVSTSKSAWATDRFCCFVVNELKSWKTFQWKVIWVFTWGNRTRSSRFLFSGPGWQYKAHQSSLSLSLSLL